MRLNVKAEKYKNAVLIGICAVIWLCSALFPIEQKDIDADVKISDYSASVNSQRVAFITQNKLRCENEPFEVVDVIIPSEFNSLYQSFEAIQKAQGLSLENYKGKRVKRYSYKILNSRDFAELFVFENRIIACAVVKNSEKAEFIKLIP